MKQAQAQRQAMLTEVKQTQEQEKGHFSFFLFLRLCLLHDFTRVNRECCAWSCACFTRVNQALDMGVGVHIHGFDII